MSELFNFLYLHSFWSAIAAYWIFSSAVSAMPAPMPNGNPGYTWLYQFLHTIAGNLTTAFGSKIPGLTAVKSVLIVLMIPLMLSLSACAGYRVHPGATNKTDSVTYDALLVAATVIDQGRADYASGKLPDSAKGPFNALVAVYNVTRESWLTYRGAVATNVPSQSYFDQLSKNIADLSTAISAFQGGKK